MPNVTSITIESHGSSPVVIDDTFTLAGGNIQLAESGNRVDISYDGRPQVASAYYEAKYQALINGGSGSGYTFTGAPYYIGSINGVGANNRGHFFVTSKSCVQPGLIESGALTPGQLTLFDQCTPPVKCSDFENLFEKMKLVAAALDRIKENIIGTPTNKSGAVLDAETDYYGIYQQWVAVVHMWNYLVRKALFMPNVTVSGGLVAVAARYSHTGVSSSVVSVAISNAFYVTNPYTSTIVSASGSVKEAHLTMLPSKDNPDDEPAVTGQFTITSLEPGRTAIADFFINIPFIEVTDPETSKKYYLRPEYVIVEITWSGTLFGTVSVTKTLNLPAKVEWLPEEITPPVSGLEPA